MAHNFAKKISENKLKAFSIGNMGKRTLSKKEQEELKKREQQEAAAQVFQEFVETFQEAPAKSSKVWVKAGTYDAGRRQEDTRERGKLYKPTSRLSEHPEKHHHSSGGSSSSSRHDYKPDKPGKKKEKEKKKSNLELFKEELKMIQEEREERHKYKQVITGHPSKYSEESSASLAMAKGETDPNTTNLYLGNLNPKISEQQLMEIFGKYGPLASIKIMWPRSDEEKARGRNCGFVAYMNRKDGERALKNLGGKMIMDYEMKLGWGKSVPIPSYPIYIPPSLEKLTMPPPPSGLPFNAQPSHQDRDKIPPIGTPYPEGDDPNKDEFDKILSRAVVKVVIPTERNLLCLIHRMVEFVVREGPLFEAMIMNREINNPMFRFLFENQSPAHTYYRFKLYSILQGEAQNKWRTDDFRIFKDGSVWRPPPMNPFTQGMPEELVEPDPSEPKKGELSAAQRDRFETMLRNLTPQKSKIGEVMVFCMEHSEAAEEVCECIAESLNVSTTALHKKIARLHLISDILHNCGVKITNASYYRRGFESKLPQIFISFSDAYKSIESRLKAEAFKMRVMQVFRAWEDWTIYPRDYLIRLQNNFLGLSKLLNIEDEPPDEGSPENDDGSEDLDGIPLDGSALKAARERLMEEDDLDGVPLDDDIDGVPMEDYTRHFGMNSKSAGFVPSKWETVDPEQVEAQAMTTLKWESLEHSNTRSADDDNDSDDGVVNDDLEGEYENREMTEERRAKLREIELKVMTYQDQLESGDRSIKSNCSILQQVEHYRKKLLRKVRNQPIFQVKDRKQSVGDKEKRGIKFKISSTPVIWRPSVVKGKEKKPMRNEEIAHRDVDVETVCRLMTTTTITAAGNVDLEVTLQPPAEIIGLEVGALGDLLDDLHLDPRHTEKAEDR
ncbi:U2 snRNP-associated SURP motif-containing protein isoform X2 [Neocloeon triangulifer]|uniref:U2 snRNP-associated SURP motif-containing protein isoform X2 n=1 Tax=Neocloeon triangulifer TaxID=2078957 RepID=UPI00286F6164|nr:U2 snRNP-associated SURP motif-containing protein isoform X2 [Neocloeon triangulifer]